MTPSPIARLASQFQLAREQRAPCALYASFITVDQSGHPASRIVPLLGLDEDGVAISVNAASPKILQLRENGKWELSGFWPTLMVQYRLRGEATLEQDERTRRDWQAKRRASRLADLYHPHVRRQSSPLPTRETLKDEMRRLEQNLADDVDAPPAIALLRLRPDMLELWTGSLADRLHDRRLYRKHADGWTETLLVP